ncbi:MAG: hypothetical protein ACFCBW_12675 [Candidatus Competibacterales bacterium]
MCLTHRICLLLTLVLLTVTVARADQRALCAEKTSFHVRSNHLIAVEGDRAQMISHGYA